MCVQSLYKEGALQIPYTHTYTHFGLFSYKYGGASQSLYREGFCKAPIEKEICKAPVENGFCKALTDKGLHKVPIQKGYCT